MNTFTRLHFLTREDALRYPFLMDLKRPAEIINVGLSSDPTKPAESFDIVADDNTIGIYYHNDQIKGQQECLFLDIPSRAGRLFLNGLQDYLLAEHNWIYFRIYDWKAWKNLFIDIGFEEG